MATVNISPNMNLTIPVTGQEVGPDWANDLNNSLSVVDAHNHAPGSGVLINPNGMNINSDLAFNLNNATLLRSARFSPQTVALSNPADIGCLYEAGVDLYYNDGSGNQIRITQSGSVAGSSGTITGLPSGTASAAYTAISGTFVFQQATSTAANIDAATYILRYPGSYPTPSGNYIALEAPSSLATGYAFIFPGNLPVSNQSALVSSTAGTLSYLTPNGIGAAMTSTGANAVALSMSNPQIGGVPTVGAETNSLIASRATTDQIYIVRGAINSAGGKISGEGFGLLTHGATGEFRIPFSIAFSDIPAVTASIQTGGGEYSIGVVASTTFVDIFLFNNLTPVDIGFSFIAIGKST